MKAWCWVGKRYRPTGLFCSRTCAARARWADETQAAKYRSLFYLRTEKKEKRLAESYFICDWCGGKYSAYYASGRKKPLTSRFCSSSHARSYIWRWGDPEYEYYRYLMGETLAETNKLHAKEKLARARSNRTDNRVMLTIFNEIKSIIDWSRDIRCVVSYNVLRARIRKGWEPARALVTPLSSASSEISAQYWKRKREKQETDRMRVEALVKQTLPKTIAKWKGDKSSA